MINSTEFLELRAFLAVGEHLSFRGAARSLGVSPSAISAQVARFEERLGLRLFHRTTRSVSLTSDGEALYHDAAPELANLAFALSGARSKSREIRGGLKIHAFRAAAELFLDRALPDFLAAYPDMRIDLTVNDGFVDLAAGGYDLSIRLNEALEPGLVAEPLGNRLHQIVVAASSYLIGADKLARPQDLASHNCIRWRWPGAITPEPWQFYIEGQWKTFAVGGNLVVDDRDRLRRAVAAGVGVAMVTEEMVRDYLLAGTVTPVLQQWRSEFEGFYLCWVSGKKTSPAAVALIKWLREAELKDARCG